MSNFTFLQQEWPDLHTEATKVESLTHSDPRACCFYARRTLELAVQWLYVHDATFVAPYEDSLNALIHEPSFRDSVPPEVFAKAKLIKNVGNLAVHSGKPIKDWDALQATRELFHVLYWLARTYTRQGAQQYQGLAFDETKLPPPQNQVIQQTIAQLKKLETALADRDAQLKAREAQLEALGQVPPTLEAEIAKLKQEIAEAKKQNQLVPDTHDYSEAQTRKYIIDLLLREAGWPLANMEDREYPVTGMPNQKGTGFVDYVLWGDDGLPLGIVEAKRTTKDSRIGQEQAKLYANCLEKQFNRRPIIFYTNGYQTWLWDDENYPPRPVQGFYKKDELELMIQRRQSRKPLAEAKINPTIVERPYQTLSIRSVTESMELNRRKALVVMATGAGKTRTVIALCDLLQRCNWAKRVLFLADRVALVNQAANAFKTFLPETSPVNLMTEKEETGSRVFLSTYPTMMGLIEESQDGSRRFGVGHFDLVIIDEAHRSVYQKYRAIFEYFDSLLVGLTATPKAEVDKNTYSLFDLQNGMPTFAYELDDAVKQGYLVPPKPVSVPLKFQRQGIKYDDLSEDEKDAWDALEWDENGDVPDKVDAAALNKWLFNTDTVDKVLAHLMSKGLKVAGGDRIGKTIVFAKNHNHAQFIQERFDKNYPQYKGAFARVIDNYTPYAQSILGDFSTSSKAPHIAISVDMLDTGIDVPEVVNLVFFKMVRSKTKFSQMVGRGTRLCPNLFGPGVDKEYFYIFDYCQNLEYFSQNTEGVEGSQQEPLGKKIFLSRLELLEGVKQAGAADPKLESLAAQVTDSLHTEVAAMNVENFIVRPQREHVERFQERQAWNQLQKTDVAEIATHIAGLPSELEAEDETAKRFDLLILKLQLAILNKEISFERLRDQVKEIASALEGKSAIPMVQQQMETILEIQTDEYWTDVSLPMLENLRKRLRDLVRFIDKKGQAPIFTDFEDELGEETEIALAGFASVGDFALYRKKTLQFLKDHENHWVIQKIRRNQPLSQADLQELDHLLFDVGGVGKREEFLKSLGDDHSLGEFIRKLVGLDREAAQAAFGEYLSNSTLNANQIRFINHIIDYLTQNGVMDSALLYEQPFTNLSPTGLDGVFSDSQADHIVQILHTIRANAGWGQAIGGVQ